MGNEVEIRVTVANKTGPGAKSAENNVKRMSDKSSESLKKFGEKAKFVGLAAGAALVKLGIDAIHAASDAQQSLGGTQAVFGKYAQQIIDKSKQASSAVGLSANQYRESANIVGSLFKNQGVAADQLAAKTDKVVKIGADLSATYGGTAADAVEALTAAFKGEFDPLERYGVSLKQSTINTEAYRLANVKGITAFSKLTAAQQAAYKQQATMNILNKQSADAQGQFKAQTNTMAEQVQILKAKYTDLSAQLGEKLIPIVTKLLDKGIKLTAWLEKNPKVAEAAAVAVAALAAGFVALGVAMLANPVSLVVVGLVILTAAFVAAYRKSEKFRDVMNAVFKGVADMVLGQISAMLWVFGKLFGVLGHLPGKAGAAFRSAQHAAEAARSKVDQLRHSIDNIHSKKINIRVNTTYAVYGDKGGHYEGGTFVKNKASGGIIGAATGGARGGLTWVGEQGRELVRLAPGSGVIPHGTSENIAKNWGQSGGGNTLIIEANDDAVSKWLAEMIRKFARVKAGGNVQAAFGRN